MSDELVKGSIHDQATYNTLLPPTLNAKALWYELFGEVLGMAILILLGDGTGALANNMGETTIGVWLFICVGWGLSVSLAILISFDISGAHLNSAITLSQIVDDGFPLGKGLCFMAAQLLGAFIGALILTLLYVRIQGSSHLTNFYCTQKLEGVPYVAMFFFELVATGCLVFVPKVVHWHRKSPLTRLQAGCLYGIIIFCIGLVSWWFKTFALNPARDLAPRLCWLFFEIGFQRDKLWSDVMGGGYFIIPIVAPCLGALLAGWIFKRSFSRREGTGRLGVDI